ncbi:MAG: Tad domain-containing protein [Chloroflexota bacterium]
MDATSKTISDRPRPTSPAAGQALAVTAISFVALLAMVALVIDGGNAYAQQRMTQNGTDAAAEAGAVVLANRLVGLPVTDAMVWAAVTSVGNDNDVTITSAEYTDAKGDALGASVGAGSLPSNAAGVRAYGNRSFSTFIGGIIGLTGLDANTQATAVSGYKQSTCDIAEGCALLPITPTFVETECPAPPSEPIIVGPEPEGHPWPEDPVVSILHLCTTGSGSVGWIDWNFAYGGTPDGGTEDTIASVITPDNPAITFPTWIQINQTGNVAASALQDAINRYAGQPVLLPIFTHTCGSDPIPPFDVVGNEPGATEGCQANLDDGMGTQMWYYLSGVDSLLLCGPGVDGCDASPVWTQGAYISGSSDTNTYCGTSGGIGCLVGKWVAGFASPGEIDENFPGGTSVTTGITVQLIR